MAIIVKAGPRDDTNQLIKKFKKKVLQGDFLTEIREKKFFKKPSVERREKKKEKERRSRQARRRARS